MPPSFPVAIRTKLDLTDAFADRVRTRLIRQLGHAATLIERGTVRFEDINGPRGGIDSVCRIKLVFSGRPSIQVEQRAATPELAFAQTIPSLVRTVERMREKHGLAAGRRSNGRGKRALPPEAIEAGELIGRRRGRGGDAMARALARPEKQRRDAYVDTAQPGVSASDRRAGGGHSARRNTKARTDRATATLEDSRSRPSRKSTRRSANRGKPSQGKERTAVAKSVTPTARARRAIARTR
jgi:ribosome-associated translation inhibitor RaiA